MRTFVKLILATVATFITFVLIGHCNANNIVAYPNYEHAILLCGESPTDKPVIQDVDGIAHFTSDKFGTWTVNWGHRNDPQVAELRRIAQFTCGYKKLERPWYQLFVGMAGHNHFIANTGDEVVLDHVQLGDAGEALIHGDRDLRRHMESCDQDFNTILIK